MTFTEAAAEVLRLAGKPLHYKEITELAIEKNLLSHVGKSPEVTMASRLATLLKKEDKSHPIVRVKPGVFALRDWDEKKGKKDKGEAKGEAVEAAEAEEDGGINALELEAVTEAMGKPKEPSEERATAKGRPRAPEEEDEDDRPLVSGEDALREDLAAKGAELFDDEDDDDQPILAPQGGAAGAAADPQADGSRRRRRRRRRGRGGAEFPERAPASPATAGGGVRSGGSPGDAGAPSASSLPGITITTPGETELGEATREGPAARPMVRERHQIMAGGAPSGIDVPMGEGDELAGRELADATLMVMSAFDRNAGPVPLRSIVEALMRRGRLGGDPAAATTQLSASLRADNLRRAAAAQRPRFRFSAGGRVAPTDWLLGGDLARLESEALAAVERYREAARRVFLRRIQELAGHAFVELALLALERVGFSGIKSVRRAGSPGGEAHFTAIHKTGIDEIRTAIVLRKDGREIGRERVSDLRGALHHYGQATAGWIITTGQVLSGAREEAAAPAPPVALYDGLSLCKLLEDHDVGVIRTKLPIAIPDLELIENLRG